MAQGDLAFARNNNNKTLADANSIEEMGVAGVKMLNSDRSIKSKDGVNTKKLQEITNLRTEASNIKTDMNFYKNDKKSLNDSCNDNYDIKLFNENLNDSSHLAGMTTAGNFFNPHLNDTRKYGNFDNELNNTESCDKSKTRRLKKHSRNEKFNYHTKRNYLNMEHKLMYLDNHMDNIMKNKKVQFKQKMEKFVYEVDKQIVTRQLRKFQIDAFIQDQKHCEICKQWIVIQHLVKGLYGIKNEHAYLISYNKKVKRMYISSKQCWQILNKYLIRKAPDYPKRTLVDVFYGLSSFSKSIGSKARNDAKDYLGILFYNICPVIKRNQTLQKTIKVLVNIRKKLRLWQDLNLKYKNLLNEKWGEIFLEAYTGVKKKMAITKTKYKELGNKQIEKGKKLWIHKHHLARKDQYSRDLMEFRQYMITQKGINKDLRVYFEKYYNKKVEALTRDMTYNIYQPLKANSMQNVPDIDVDHKTQIFDDLAVYSTVCANCAIFGNNSGPKLYGPLNHRKLRDAVMEAIETLVSY